MTYLEGYTKRKKITIDHAKVSATLAYFPTLIKITNDSEVGAAALSTGYDIRITSADGTTLLAYERESFSIVDSVCNAFLWVKVPSLSHTTDTVLYIYYGKADATDGENKTGVWDDGGSNNYKGVWHLEETGTGTLADYKDSTSYGNHSTNTANQPTVTPGKIANGQQFDNLDDKIECGTNTSLNLTGALTLEAWVKIIHKTTTQFIISKRSWDLSVSASDIAIFNTKLADDSAPDTEAVSPVLTSGSIYHLVCVYDPSNNSKVVYTNGSAGTSVSKTDGSTPDNSTRYFAIGKSSISNVYSPSAIDEVRVSNIARSAAWISTEYANQSDPVTFLTVGTEETDTPTPTDYIYPIISYNEENEMFQVVGTEKAHPVQLRSLSNGALLTETPTGATITVYVNGTISAETVTVSGFNSTMLRHLITVPATLAATAYDSVEINISYTDGDDVDYEGFAMVNIIPALSYFAASSEITALNDLSSADIVTAVGTALSTSDALRILDIIMSGTFTITTGEAGAFTCLYTSRTDLSTIEFTVDGSGQRTGTTVTLV